MDRNERTLSGREADDRVLALCYRHTRLLFPPSYKLARAPGNSQKIMCKFAVDCFFFFLFFVKGRGMNLNVRNYLWKPRMWWIFF